MQLKTFGSGQDFIGAVVEVVAKLSSTRSGPVYIAVSGGKTPQPIYAALAKSSQVDFNKVEWFGVDERAVPYNHPHSNYKMVTTAFTPAGALFLKHLHWFKTELSPVLAAARYEAELKAIPHTQFDLVILGIGHDGHTASLFPGSPALHETKRLAVATINENVPNPPVADRLTLTWPIILNSRRVLLLAAGKEKKEVVEALVKGPASPDELPAKQLLAHPNFTIFYLTGRLL